MNDDTNMGKNSGSQRGRGGSSGSNSDSEQMDDQNLGSMTSEEFDRQLEQEDDNL